MHNKAEAGEADVNANGETAVHTWVKTRFFFQLFWLTCMTYVLTLCCENMYFEDQRKKHPMGRWSQVRGLTWVHDVISPSWIEWRPFDTHKTSNLHRMQSGRWKNLCIVRCPSGWSLWKRMIYARGCPPLRLQPGDASGGASNMVKRACTKGAPTRGASIRGLSQWGYGLALLYLVFSVVQRKFCFASLSILLLHHGEDHKLCTMPRSVTSLF